MRSTDIGSGNRRWADGGTLVIVSGSSNVYSDPGFVSDELRIGSLNYWHIADFQQV